MSKIGKQPIKIPEGIAVTVENGTVKVRGQSGEINVPLLQGVKPIIENSELKFVLARDNKQSRNNWGTIRSLAANAVLGLTSGFEKTLILEGIGYRMAKEGNNLVLSLGFSHPVRFTSPLGINLEVEKNNILKIKGVDKILVGRVAAEIRALKKPEPYKGKGFRYSDEVIRRKAGKKAAAQSG